ncbi:MAG: hypothetical protein ACRDHP_17110 [Ktedonobacterales bacterium]
MPQFSTSAPKKRRQGKRMSPDEKRRAQAVFLATFATSANLRAAAVAAGIDRNTVYYWQEHDEAFSFRYKQAEADANDVVRAAIFQRAVVGVDKPLHYQGRLIKDEQGQRMTVKEYSDTLLIFLAKSRMPEFREKQQIEHSGTIDVNTLAAEADKKLSVFLAALGAASVLG